jgi:hypothetical protein
MVIFGQSFIFYPPYTEGEDWEDIGTPDIHNGTVLKIC